MALKQTGFGLAVVLLFGFCNAQLAEFLGMPYENTVAWPQQMQAQGPLQQRVVWVPMQTISENVAREPARLTPRGLAHGDAQQVAQGVGLNPSNGPGQEVVRTETPGPANQKERAAHGATHRPAKQGVRAAHGVARTPAKQVERIAHRPSQQTAHGVVRDPKLQVLPGSPQQGTHQVAREPAKQAADAVQHGPMPQTAGGMASGPAQWSPVNGGILSSFQDPFSVQSQQTLQGPAKKLTWLFPQTPQKPQQLLPAHFEIHQPVAAASVAAECGENMVHVEVKEDLFGIDEPIIPSALTLGGCAVSGEDSAAQVIIFEVELEACNSVLTMTEDELVYTFTLHYDPQPFAGTPIVRTGGAVTGIECHYPRLHNVSSNALMPLWIPYASTKAAEELLVFYLRLMTDDWQFERPSNQYFLGDLMNIEASVMQFNHVPLRVFVDSCVATTVPDVNAVPRYSFIENHGCLVDAKLTGSRSHFMPRVQADKLQFQLEVFMFQQQNSSLIYLTCLLKASAASTPVDAEDKACSFTANGWSNVDDDDQVCGCCDTSCGFRKGRSVTNDAGVSWEGSASLGPILVM